MSRRRLGGSERAFALMPASTTLHHEDPVTGASPCHFVEKKLHVCVVDVGQDQGVELAVSHRDCGIGIGVFLDDHGRAQ